MLQIVNFAIILIVLRAWVYKPLIIDAGKTPAVDCAGTWKMRGSPAEARANAEDEAKRLLEEANAKAADIVREADTRAEAVKKEILAEAETEATHLRKQKMAEFEQERVQILAGCARKWWRFRWRRRKNWCRNC